MQPQDIYFKYFSRKQHILTPFIGVIYSRHVGSSWQSRECSRNESRTAIYNRNFRFSHASVSGKEDQATGNTHHTTYYHDHSVHRCVWCEWLLFHVCGCCTLEQHVNNVFPCYGIGNNVQQEKPLRMHCNTSKCM